jgi:hypothetical protein
VAFFYVFILVHLWKLHLVIRGLLQRLVRLRVRARSLLPRVFKAPASIR